MDTIINSLSALKDKEKRRAIIANPRKYAQAMGLDVEGKEVALAISARDTLYVPIYRMPANGALTTAEISSMAAAGTTGSSGSMADRHTEYRPRSEWSCFPF